MYILKDRAIIEVTGVDRRDFLQGLITNDINLLDQNTIIYSFFLNANGRYFADFFICANADYYWLDCHISQIDNIIAKLNLFKLRSQVSIRKNTEIAVIFNLNNQGFSDPRLQDFGYRNYVVIDNNTEYPSDDQSNYHQRRFQFNLVEGCYDLTVDKSFPLEFGFDNFKAISYKKGCYIGQETTARTHYRGQVRKKIVRFGLKNNNFDVFLEKFFYDNQLTFNASNAWETTSLKNCVIYQDDQEIGIILSSFYDRNANSLIGLALLKDNFKNDQQSNEVNQDDVHLIICDNKISIT